MSLLVQVEEKLKSQGINGVPKTVKEILEVAEKHGVETRVEVHIPRPRDPILYIDGKPVVAWIKL